MPQRLQVHVHEEAFRQANIDICQSAMRYTEGKEKVRRTKDGQAAFDSALDAVAEVTRFAPGASARAHKILTDINEKRNENDPAVRDYLDPNSFRDRYGAAHAQQTAQQRAQQKNRVQEMPQEQLHL